MGALVEREPLIGELNQCASGQAVAHRVDGTGSIGPHDLAGSRVWVIDAAEVNVVDGVVQCWVVHADDAPVLEAKPQLQRSGIADLAAASLEISSG